MADVLIALGGNVGDVRATFQKAIANICGMTQARCWRGRPITPRRPGATKQQARFINACIEIETGLDPHALLFTLHKIENKFGRDRASERRWGPRTLDLDLIAYDDVSIAKAGTDAAASAPVRARLRAGAARRDRARPCHCGTQRCRGAGPAIDRGDRAAARPRADRKPPPHPENNRLAWPPPRGNFRSNNKNGAREHPAE